MCHSSLLPLIQSTVGIFLDFVNAPTVSASSNITILRKQSECALSTCYVFATYSIINTGATYIGSDLCTASVLILHDNYL